MKSLHAKRGEALWAALAAVVLAPAAMAEPLVYFGEVGRAPVFVTLDRDGASVSGWYLYLRQARDISLKGAIDAGGRLTLDEFALASGVTTGVFQGRPDGAGWSGDWVGADGRRLAFSLRPDRDTLADLDGPLRCTASQPGGDYRFEQSLDLRAAKGRLTRFSYATRAKSEDDENDCSIDLAYLKPVPAPSGIALRARADDPADTSEDARHCSLHLRGDRDFLVIQVDGCQGAGDTMFCSARGGWTDLVVDRHSRMCKAVE